MKLETIEEYKKETRFLYKLLKETYRKMIECEHTLYAVAGPVISSDDKEMLIESSWKVYQIEHNIKEEDYNI